MNNSSSIDFMGLNLSSLNYEKYLDENPIYKFFGDSRSKNPSEKIVFEPYLSVNPENDVPFVAEYDDLIRLHYITRIRKATTIMEFGLGKSTVVLADALLKNKSELNSKIKNSLRRSNPFECHSIENSAIWIERCKKLIPKKFFEQGTSHIHNASLKMGTFSNRICTYYDPLPDISPDLIYLDGPDQFSSEGDVKGMSTRHPDRMPMAADILSFEHFLTPGTLIIVDGRTANARFLKSNFQRNWNYFYAKDFDQHFFELLEEPLGVYNQRQIDICLGKSYYERLKKFTN
jgi:hypothetical protein